MAYDIHAVPGRLRVKVPVLRSNPHAQEEMIALLSGLKGTGSVTVNPVTGSVVINYDPIALDSQKILKVLKARGYLKQSGLRTAEQGHSPLPKAREALGRALFGWAVGNLLEGTGLGFLAVLI